MLSDLQGCRDVHDLAALLNIPTKILTFLLYSLPPSAKYTSFCISKKNGGTRQILAPEKRLKSLQRKLTDLLVEIDLELQGTHPRPSSMGCEKGKGLFDNTSPHSRRRWVFNCDIEDFFGTINFGRVIGYFKKNSNLALQPKIATYLAQICCHNNALPQGAPTSPIVANLICSSLDYRLAKFARRNRCTYTRYVDDITFSTNQREFPTAIAKPSSDQQGWVAGDELVGRISGAGFTLNPVKSRMSMRTSRQTVTGLTVNAFPNASREYQRSCRAAVHAAMNGRPFTVPPFTTPYRDNCDDPSGPEIEWNGDLARLESRLAFVHSIRSRDRNFNLRRLLRQPSGTFRDYVDAIQLRLLCNNPRPLIITEGPSDTLYLKAAMLGLNAAFPEMSELDSDGNRHLSISFAKPGKPASKVIGLASGNGDLKNFLSRAVDFYGRLSSKVDRRRIIILVDNDDGLDHLKKIVKDVYKIQLDKADNQAFYKLEKDFYLVKTPHKAGKIPTSIEDFVPPPLFSDPVSGRTFTADENYDRSQHFGKIELSKRMYALRNQISPTEMTPILIRIQAAINAT